LQQAFHQPHPLPDLQLNYSFHVTFASPYRLSQYTVREIER
jgi:hypothetical protein